MCQDTRKKVTAINSDSCFPLGLFPDSMGSLGLSSGVPVVAFSEHDPSSPVEHGDMYSMVFWADGFGTGDSGILVYSVPVSTLGFDVFSC